MLPRPGSGPRPNAVRVFRRCRIKTRKDVEVTGWVFLKSVTLNKKIYVYDCIYQNKCKYMCVLNMNIYLYIYTYLMSIQTGPRWEPPPVIQTSESCQSFFKAELDYKNGRSQKSTVANSDKKKGR